MATHIGRLCKAGAPRDVSQEGERKGGGIGWPWLEVLPHPCTWKEVLLLSNQGKLKLESLK